MRLLPLVLTLAATPPALAAKPLKQASAGLESAVQNPDLPPPPLLFGEYEQERLSFGAVLFDYQRIKGHDLALAAKVSDATEKAVWDLILDVESYPDHSYAVEWARIDARVAEGTREKIDATVSIAIPQLPCEVALRAWYDPSRGYMPFYLVEAKGNPMKHFQGYWSVTPYPGERILILFLVDLSIDYPLPQEMRVSLAEKGAKMLLEELAERAEATSVYE